MNWQEDNVTVAALESDPFIDCYRAWLKAKQFSSATGADFLEIFTQTSGGVKLLVIRIIRALAQLLAACILHYVNYSTGLD
jgi:hypothetical protein